MSTETAAETAAEPPDSPVTDPAEAVTDPAGTVTDPGVPATDSGVPVTDLAGAATDPGVPETDPGVPATDTGAPESGPQDESAAETTPLRLVVVTGMSGAGRSTVANALEDLGWYVVDNLPPTVLPEVCALARGAGLARLAVVIDVRTRAFFEMLPGMFTDLGQERLRAEIVFLEAADDVIVRRQESVRRPHPLQGDGRLLDGIVAERRKLAALRAAADLVIDTSALNVHQLSSRISQAYGSGQDAQLRVTLMSFGFKNGLPVDADLVLDVRFLPNPHWVPDLRPQTGLSRPVSDYVLGADGAQEFLERIEGLLDVVGRGYIREGKRFATVAIGCTGGKHRSTAMTEELARRLRARQVPTTVLHRDLGRE